MARVTFKKGDEYLAKIAKIERNAREEVLGPAIYEGANIVADEIKANLESVPTDEKWAPRGYVKAGPRKAELQGLLSSFGIAKLQNTDGFINVKLGFDGYNKIKSNRWPTGQPNQVIGRSIERGTSFMEAHPFVKPAVSATRQRVLAVMQKAIDEQMEKQMK